VDLTEFAGWVTVVGAFVAAVTGVWNLSLQIRGKQDRFAVGLGSVSPTIEQETMMHVVSHSDHPIKLKDWGFIEPSGSLRSIPLSWETSDLQSDDIVSRGSSELVTRGAVFETGYLRRMNPIGAFAIGVTQQRPHICFDPDVPYWRRVSIRCRLLRTGTRYLA